MVSMKYLAVTCERKEDLSILRENQADEVILALKDHCFSALCAFTKEEIRTMIEESHRLGLKTTIVMNRLFHQNEYEEAQKTMMEMIAAGADHIDFADPCLALKAMQEGCLAKLIYDSLTMMTNHADAGFWLETGVDTIILSPLLTKQEIIAIAKQTAASGAIVHGRLLMSVSKRKLLSAFSEEYDLPALKYKRNITIRECKRDEHMPVYEDDTCMMVYTDYVQESFDEMKAFMDAGIQRFEIRGEFLPDEAVQDALKIYRGLLAEKDMESEIQTYRETYRGLSLSDGYYGQKTVK